MSIWIKKQSMYHVNYMLKYKIHTLHIKSQMIQRIENMYYANTVKERTGIAILISSTFQSKEYY